MFRGKLRWMFQGKLRWMFRQGPQPPLAGRTKGMLKKDEKSPRQNGGQDEKYLLNWLPPPG
jgi:hypothetical protein